MHLLTPARSVLLAMTLTAVVPVMAQQSQQQQRTAPTASTEEVPTAPSAPAPTAGAPNFPPVDPGNFTAASPSKETVNAFLQQLWGYDPDRVWQVQAIQKTAAPGVSKVTVLAAQKTNPQQIGSLQFFVTPDGQHLISNEVMPFGARPFDAARKVLQASANGPSRGAASKELLLVEFADFQCPHCKEAQPTVQRLLADFPNAHFVFENLPLTSIHPEAYKAAAYGVCVAKLGGNDAFFQYAETVFTNQASLTPEAAATTLNDAATKAGVDAAKAAACADSPEARGAVDASLHLAQELNVNETPWLFINGRGLPLNSVPYETLKKIVEFQAQSDK
ncbi:DsbA family protein [Pseudacidobacterium ailaaui]|jgi:protein-disulfide isomerase|uniref:DsbA family protein n=1 Tax=Pseudacidobacterium ailaaui TaxID=1382359 RepID=UPI00047BA150|nr:thioredoxin domain-containing protein [Pseudacidobacterium ailaaui]